MVAEEMLGMPTRRFGILTPQTLTVAEVSEADAAELYERTGLFPGDRIRAVDGKEVDDNIRFGEKVETLERLVFRTGPWRGCVWPFIVNRQPATKGLYVEDLLGTDDKSPLSVYLIDDVKTKSD